MLGFFFFLSVSHYNCDYIFWTLYICMFLKVIILMPVLPKLKTRQDSVSFIRMPIFFKKRYNLFSNNKLFDISHNVCFSFSRLPSYAVTTQ